MMIYRDYNTEAYRLTGICTGRYNGAPIKMFTLWIRQGNAYVHAGTHTAPKKTRTRDLFSTVEPQS